MFNTISSEFYKLRKSTGFWIMIFIAGVLAIFTSLMFGLLPIILPNDDFAAMGLQPASVSEILNSAMSSNISNILFILVGFTIVFINSDFSSGTIRNPLAIGISRVEYYFGKLVTVLVTCAAFVIVTTLGTALPYFLFEPWGDAFSFLPFLSGLAIGYLILVTQATLFMAVALIMRKLGATLGIVIGYLVLDMIIGGFVMVVAMTAEVNPVIRGLLNIFPTPAAFYIGEVSAGVADVGNVILLIAVSVGVIVVMSLFAIRSLSKKDV